MLLTISYSKSAYLITPVEPVLVLLGYLIIIINIHINQKSTILTSCEILSYKGICKFRM